MQILCVGQATVNLSSSGEQALPFFIGYSKRRDAFFVFRIPGGVKIDTLDDCLEFTKQSFYLAEYTGLKKVSTATEFPPYRDAVEQQLSNLSRFWDCVDVA